MNKTIKNHTTKKYHYDNFEQLKNHLNDFLRAYNFGKRLKSLKYLKFLTPYQTNLDIYNNPNYKYDCFNSNFVDELRGLNKLCKVQQLHKFLCTTAVRVNDVINTYQCI